MLLLDDAMIANYRRMRYYDLDSVGLRIQDDEVRYLLISMVLLNYELGVE
jgi:hypothetical protein